MNQEDHHKTSAVLIGDNYHIKGHKAYSSGISHAEYGILTAVMQETNELALFIIPINKLNKNSIEKSSNKSTIWPVRAYTNIDISLSKRL